jgi:hypothetical protein
MSMPALTDEYVLAAYVEGSDLKEVASLVRSRLTKFIADHRWSTDQLLFVDQVEELLESTDEDFLPAWDLGINLGLDHHSTDANWFVDVEALVRMLQSLHIESGRDFVLFLCFRSRPWLQEHLDFIGSRPVDLKWLKDAMQRLMASKRQ